MNIVQVDLLLRALWDEVGLLKDRKHALANGHLVSTYALDIANICILLICIRGRQPKLAPLPLPHCSVEAPLGGHPIKELLVVTLQRPEIPQP